MKKASRVPQITQIRITISLQKSVIIFSTRPLRHLIGIALLVFLLTMTVRDITILKKEIFQTLPLSALEGDPSEKERS